MNHRLSPTTRRLVLGGALLGAIIVALGPHAAAVHAGESAQAASRAATAAPAAARSDLPNAAAPAGPASAKAKTAARDAEIAGNDKPGDADDDDSANVTIDRHGIRVDEGGSAKKKKHVVVSIGNADREYDSVDQFAKQDPALFGMVVGIVFIVFLTPVLVIALLIWYKLRKNRMLNETMLQLAERGAIAPGDAIQSLQSGRTAPAAQLPLAERARWLRSQAVWSDLRRGVILGALGLAFCAYSLFDDHTPNWIGLILLFLGLGYTLLWFFEDRQLAAPADSRPPSPPAGGA